MIIKAKQKSLKTVIETGRLLLESAPEIYIYKGGAFYLTNNKERVAIVSWTEDGGSRIEVYLERSEIMRNRSWK